MSVEALKLLVYEALKLLVHEALKLLVYEALKLLVYEDAALTQCLSILPAETAGHASNMSVFVLLY
jgi:hypothetical protein